MFYFENFIQKYCFVIGKHVVHCQIVKKKTEINTPSMAFIFFVCVNMVWAIERTNEFYQFNFHGNLN